MRQQAGSVGRAIQQATIIVLISLLLGEAVVRIFHHFKPLFIFYDGSYNRFRGKPFADDFSFKLNSQGFKDTEFSTQKDPRHYRILALGDSFAFGVVPYQDNYLTLIESAGPPVNVEVFNMGIPDIGPEEYKSLLMREGLAVHPDLVLVSFFVGNDFNDSLAAKRRQWYTYSYLATLAHYLYAVQPKFEGRIILDRLDYCDDCPSLEASAYLQLEKDRSLLYWTGYPKFPRLLDGAVEYLEQIRDICRQHAAELVVVIIPDELQVNPALQRGLSSQRPAGFEPGAWDTTRPNAHLSARLQASGIDVLDLYPYFVGQNEPLYRPRDSHWNIAGNRLAARIIQKHLADYVERHAAGLR